jgi:hypothetical protein
MNFDNNDEVHLNVSARPLQTDKICLDKIKALLVNDDLKCDERSLVVLTLLTRVDGTDHLVIEDVMGSNRMFCFIIRLIRSNHPSLVRLACRCVSGLRRRQYDWIRMAHTLLTAVKYRTSLRTGKTDGDLLHALVCCIENDESIKTRGHYFDCIWQRFCSGTRTPDPDSPDEDDTFTTAIDAHWQFVDQSIEQVLRREDEQTWMNSLMRLWDLIAPELCRTLTFVPEWYRSFLLSIVSMDSNLRRSNHGHAMVLQFTIAMAAFMPAFNFTCHHAEKALADLIMVQIGSPESDLRSQAWDAVSMLVSRHGWNWISNPDDDITLTITSRLCIWTRLAAGEYRIQLGLMCAKFGTSFQIDTVNACGLVVVSALRRVLEEAANLDSGEPTTLDTEAILHLRQSLNDTLQSSISYVASEELPTLATCKVMGSLLGEISIWDELPNGTAVDEALLAISNCMANNVVEIMPCLVNVFDSEVLHGERMQLIRSAGMLGDRLPAYFSHYWRERAFHDVASIPLACRAIENWDFIADPTMKQRRSVAKEILCWMEKALEKGVTDSIDADAVISAVGSYVVLLGDHQPPAQDAALVQAALSKCGTIEKYS